MDDRDFSAGEPTPRPHLPRWKVLRVPQGLEPIALAIVSNRVYSVNTHFDGYARQICKKADCDPALHAKTIRWYGYFQAISMRHKEVILLEVPEDAFLQMRTIMVDAGGTYRGLLLQFNRVSLAKNARINVELKDIMRGRQAIPDEIDMWPMIYKLFKVN